MRHDLLADSLSKMTNAIRVGKKECVVKPTSKLFIKVLELFKKEGFISAFETAKDNTGGSVKILFNGNINQCFAVKPRFSAKNDEIEKFEKRYLPARDFGTLIVSTPKGLVTHQELKESGMGGKLIAYIY